MSAVVRHTLFQREHEVKTLNRTSRTQHEQCWYDLRIAPMVRYHRWLLKFCVKNLNMAWNYRL